MIFDIVVLAALALSGIIAFFRGLIREVLTVAGVLGGAVAASYGGPVFAPVVRGWFGIIEGEEVPKLFDIVPYTIVADAIAYGSIFVIVVVILSVTSHILSKSAEAMGMGAIDRTLGVFFGVIRGILLLGLLYSPIYLLTEPEQRDTWFESSKTRGYVEFTAEKLVALLPESATEDLEKTIEEKAVKASETAREKLMQLDVLGDDKDSSAGPDTDSDTDKNKASQDSNDTQDEDATGYDEQQIEEFRQLIEEQYKDNE